MAATRRSWTNQARDIGYEILKAQHSCRLRVDRGDREAVASRGERAERAQSVAEALSVEAGEPLTCRAATRAESQGGVDASLEYPSGLSVPVQIAKAPSQSEYGAAVAKGFWRVVVTVDRAASWIKSTIDHTTTGRKLRIAPADRAAMILALDIRHAGQLVNADVLMSFARQMPGAAQLGFRAIWLVCSTPVGSKRIA